MLVCGMWCLGVGLMLRSGMLPESDWTGNHRCWWKDRPTGLWSQVKCNRRMLMQRGFIGNRVIFRFARWK